jgi:hypothetical protein
LTNLVLVCIIDLTVLKEDSMHPVIHTTVTLGLAMVIMGTVETVWFFQGKDHKISNALFTSPTPIFIHFIVGVGLLILALALKPYFRQKQSLDCR